MTTLFVKAPTEVLDFTVTWTSWLTGGETIATSTWAADAGITIDSDTNTGTVATVWLSAGTLGNSYDITNTIVTDNATPRTGVRVITIFVKDGYITLSDLRSYLGVKSASDDGLLTQCIDDAQKWIEEYTNRVFVAETATKYFGSDSLDYRNSSILIIDDDLLTITTLTNGDTNVIAAANYWLGSVDDHRLNRNDGTPHHGIQLTNDGGYSWTWNTDGWVSILGTWGYSTTAPADIQQAMRQLSAYDYRLKDSQIFDITAMPEQGVIQIPKGIPTGVYKIVNKYRKAF